MADQRGEPRSPGERSTAIGQKKFRLLHNLLKLVLLKNTLGQPPAGERESSKKLSKKIIKKLSKKS
jgi:hypothetical protein